MEDQAENTWKEFFSNKVIAVLDEISFWGEVLTDYWNQETDDNEELLREYQEAVKEKVLASETKSMEQDKIA